MVPEVKRSTRYVFIFGGGRAGSSCSKIVRGIGGGVSVNSRSGTAYWTAAAFVRQGFEEGEDRGGGRRKTGEKRGGAGRRGAGWLIRGSSADAVATLLMDKARSGYWKLRCIVGLFRNVYCCRGEE